MTYLAPVTVTSPTPGFSGLRTLAQGTITNTGTIAGSYDLRVVSSSGEVSTARSANAVLPGETAVWITQFVGEERGVASIRVNAWALPALGPPQAAAVITSTAPTQDSYYGLATAATGTITNTGTTIRSFVVELQAGNGQVSLADAMLVPAGKSAVWRAVFAGPVTGVRIVRAAWAVSYF